VEPLNYSLLETIIPEVSSCRHLGIVLCSDFIWAGQVNYTVKKAWKALHFTICILKMGKNNIESLAYASLAHPIIAHGAACWDPYREEQINVLD
jgi:hypothetical protein